MHEKCSIHSAPMCESKSEKKSLEMIKVHYIVICVLTTDSAVMKQLQSSQKKLVNFENCLILSSVHCDLHILYLFNWAENLFFSIKIL